MSTLILNEQIQNLKGKFQPPSDFRIAIHKDSNGKDLLCCQAAYAYFCGSINGAYGANGVCGVIDFLATKFHWGCIPCVYFCDCLKHADHVYCTATMGLGLEAMRRCQIQANEVPFRLVTVEVINRHGKASVELWRTELSDTSVRFQEQPVFKEWLSDDFGYHNLVGIVDKNDNLTLCDYDGKFFMPRGITTDEFSMVAIRVVQWTGCASRGSGAAPLLQVNWNGVPLTLNKWEDITPERVPTNLSREEQIALLTSAFRQNCAISSPGITQDHSCSASPTTTESSLTPISIARAFSHANLELSHPSTAPAPPASPPLSLLITGIYMGPNPCPGVGVARAVRAANPHAHIAVADDSKFSDPVFSEFHKVEELNNTVSTAGAGKQRQWDIVAGLLHGLQTTHDQCVDSDATPPAHGVYYFPCRDRDIDVAATAKTALSQDTPAHKALLADLNKAFGVVAVALAASVEGAEDLDCDDGHDGDDAALSIDDCACNTGIPAAQLMGLVNTLLCPVQEVVALTDKPLIRAVTQGPLGRYFQVPEHFPLSTTGPDGSSTACSMLEARFFAETQGYPIMVKGPHQGAQLCYSWGVLAAVLRGATWVHGGFLQRPVPGWEKCMAFAAYDGVLTGACMMTKGTYTIDGKVWSGDIEPVPADLLQGLRGFVELTKWTGGGEIEFVEEIVATSPSGVGRWAIDFNPRFPAWIFASAYAGCNLPALLLQHAQQAQADPNSVWHHPSVDDSRAALDVGSALGETRASFVRSVVEVPITHIEHCRTLPISTKLSAATGCSAGKLGTAKALHASTAFPVLPQACSDNLSSGSATDTTAMSAQQLQCASAQVQHVTEDLRRLLDAVTSRLSCNPDMIEHSPRFVLNIDSVDALLKRNKRIMECAMEVTNAKLSAAGAFANGASSPLQLQMCLSVKTQPNTQVVRAAETNGYLAECIDMAEVYHSVQDAGFPFQRVVLTGPGKWWDRIAAPERAAQMSTFHGPRKLHAVFADSLADLRTIVARLLDPSDELDAEVIGIRWAPICGTASRFGLDPEDQHVVQEAAQVIASLPLGRFRLGMHFHHASSVLGGKRWFALANAFAVFCGQFAAMCGCSIGTIDFGGGFEPHFLESEFAAQNLPALFETVHAHCNQRGVHNSSSASTDAGANAAPVCVQFELGKSVSEDAGGVLTRILAIRENRDKWKPKSRGNHNHTVEEEQKARDKVAAGAIVVDTTVADVSTPNAKPVFLVRLPGPDAAPGTLPQCTPLAVGDTQIWGRTCMEWDTVKGSFTLPADVKVGDLLLIAGCGAYDMSMQYDFGDGVGRTHNVIVL